MTERSVLNIVDHAGVGGAQRVLEGILTLEETIGYGLRKKPNQQIATNEIQIRDTKSRYDIKSILELQTLIRNHDIKIIHTHLKKSTMVGLLLKKIDPRLKLVVHVHGSLKREPLVYGELLRISKSEVDLFIAISETVENEIKEQTSVATEKIEKLPNFVDTEVFSHKESRGKRKDTCDENIFTVGFAGRIVERKGWKEYIRAAEIIENNYDDEVRFLVVGEGKQKEEMANQIRNSNLNSVVTMLGYVEDIDCFYSNLDCFVMPSRWEPMGLTHLEAQASGVPVIATDIDGITDVLGDSCMYFNKNCEHELSDKIITLKNDEKLRKNLVQKGLENVEKYSLGTYLENLRKIYQSISELDYYAKN